MKELITAAPMGQKKNSTVCHIIRGKGLVGCINSSTNFACESKESDKWRRGEWSERRMKGN